MSRRIVDDAACLDIDMARETLKDVVEIFKTTMNDTSRYLKERDYKSIDFGNADTLMKAFGEIYKSMFSEADAFFAKHDIKPEFESLLEGEVSRSRWGSDGSKWHKLAKCAAKQNATNKVAVLKRELDFRALSIIADYANVVLVKLNARGKGEGDTEILRKSLKGFWRDRDIGLDAILKNCISSILMYKVFSSMKDIARYVEEIDRMISSSKQTKVYILNVSTDVLTSEDSKRGLSDKGVSTETKNPIIKVVKWTNGGGNLVFMRDGPNNDIKLRSLVVISKPGGITEIHASQYDTQGLRMKLGVFKMDDEKQGLVFTSKNVLEYMSSVVKGNDPKSGSFLNFGINKSVKLGMFKPPPGILQYSMVFDVQGNVKDAYKGKVGGTLVIPYVVDNLVSTKVIHDMITTMISNSDALQTKFNNNKSYTADDITYDGKNVICSVNTDDIGYGVFKDLMESLGDGVVLKAETQ